MLERPGAVKHKQWSLYNRTGILICEIWHIISSLASGRKSDGHHAELLLNCHASRIWIELQYLIEFFAIEHHSLCPRRVCQSRYTGLRTSLLALVTLWCSPTLQKQSWKPALSWVCFQALHLKPRILSHSVAMQGCNHSLCYTDYTYKNMLHICKTMFVQKRFLVFLLLWGTETLLAILKARTFGCL